MKKLFYSFMVIALVFALASCGKDKPSDEPTDPNQEQTDPTTPSEEDEDPAFAGFTKLTSVVRGTAYPTTDYPFIDILFANATEKVCVNVNVEEDTEVLPTGTYLCDEKYSYKAGTFDPKYSYLVTASNDTVRFNGGGEIIVEKAGNTYTVKVDVSTEEGDTYKYYYKGAIDLDVYYFQPQTAFDLTWESMDDYYSYYWYESKISRYAMDIDLLDPKTGWEIVIEIVTTATDPEGHFPAGTYNMLKDDWADNGIIPGYKDEYSSPYGSYTTNWQDGVAYFVDGSFNITVDGDNTTLTGSFTDEGGNVVTVSFTGETPTVDFVEKQTDGVTDPAPASRSTKQLTAKITRN